MMKKLTIMALAILLAAEGMAQSNKAGRWYDYDRKTYVGVRLGLSASQMFLSGLDEASASTRAGWNVGMVMGQQIGGAGVPLYVEAGFSFVQKPVTAVWGDKRLETNKNYISIPIVFKYKVATAVDDLSVQPYAGGYIAIGVGGETRLYPDRKKTDTFCSDYLGRIDGGLRLGCGLAYQNFYFDMAYDIGLANIARSGCQYLGYDNFDNRIRSGNFTATIGLDF